MWSVYSRFEFISAPSSFCCSTFVRVTSLMDKSKVHLGSLDSFLFCANQHAIRFLFIYFHFVFVTPFIYICLVFLYIVLYRFDGLGRLMNCGTIGK